MAEDTPDFGVSEYRKTTSEGAAHLDVSLAEVLAELETINVHQANIENATIDISNASLISGVPLRYRSGSPFYIEDFEYDNNIYEGSGSGTGNASARDNTRGWSKGASWKLTAGSDASHNSRVAFRMGSYSKVKMGFQFCLSWNYRLDYFTAELVLVWNDVRYDLEISIWDDLKRIQITDENGVNQTVYTWTVINRSEIIFHFIKVLFNPLTGKWDKLYFDDHEIDLSAYGLDTSAGTDTGYIYWRFSNIGSAGYNPDCHIDNICFTDES